MTVFKIAPARYYEDDIFAFDDESNCINGLIVTISVGTEIPGNGVGLMSSVTDIPARLHNEIVDIIHDPDCGSFAERLRLMANAIDRYESLEEMEAALRYREL